ncbi:hypothetical protein LCGC14_1751450 [marine sediment metagenome]|uniref:Uncharacterized protein n=1 Tax=marine sediment metagenome TaxID=412755 RepID=A0A0F9H3N6_9ZZZZ
MANNLARPRSQRPARDAPQSQRLEEFFAPTSGFTNVPAIVAPPSSIVSGENVWVFAGRIEPRWRLEETASNVFSDRPNGAFDYDAIDGTIFPIVTSAGTVAVLVGDAYSTLGYVSGVSNLPPSGGQNDDFFGTSVYLTRSDINIAAITNGVDPVFVATPADNTRLSTLTQGPIAKDLALFDNRLVGWNIQELSSSSRFVNRAQWAAAGDPEDWTGIGSGFEDLIDMRGEGTRVIATEQDILCFSTEEVWRGRRLGDATFVFRFTPLTKEAGAPFGRAVIQTTEGIFWLGNDFNIWRFLGGQVSRIGTAIQRTLRDTAKSLRTSFFSYNAELNQLSFYYSVTVGSLPTRSFTLHLDSGAWTPHTFGFDVVRAFPLAISTSATTWDGLVGALSAQLQTYDEFLGLTGVPSVALLTSDGTTAFFNDSATTDLGATVVESVAFGPMFNTESRFSKLCNEVRLDVSAPSTSSLSIALSDDLGATYNEEKKIAISATSGGQHSALTFDTEGRTITMRLREDHGVRWQVSRIYANADTEGRP